MTLTTGFLYQGDQNTNSIHSNPHLPASHSFKQIIDNIFHKRRSRNKNKPIDPERRVQVKDIWNLTFFKLNEVEDEENGVICRKKQDTMQESKGVEIIKTKNS